MDNKLERRETIDSRQATMVSGFSVIGYLFDSWYLITMNILVFNDFDIMFV